METEYRLQNDSSELELDQTGPDTQELNLDVLDEPQTDSSRSVEDPDAGLCYIETTAPELAREVANPAFPLNESTVTFDDASPANQAMAAPPIAKTARGARFFDLERRPYGIWRGTFARVPLTRQRFALCDEQDAKFISDKKPVLDCRSPTSGWCYAKFPRDERGHSEFVHRAIALQMGADATQPFVVDHINGVGLDNRRENLRLVYRSDPANTLNRSYRTDSKIPLNGVFPSRDGRGRIARIIVGGVCRYEELFQHAIDAAENRDAKAQELKLPVRFNNPMELKCALGFLVLTFPQHAYDEMLLQHRRDTGRKRRKPYIDETLGCAVVPMSDGAKALCDVEDIGKVAPYSWWPQRKERHGKTVSVCAKIEGKRISMANYLKKENGDVLTEGAVWDHIGRDPLDNRKHRLRAATPKRNGENRSKPRNGNIPLHRVSRRNCGLFEANLGSGKSRKVRRTWSLALTALFSDALLLEDKRTDTLNFPELTLPLAGLDGKYLLKLLEQLPPVRRRDSRRSGNENGFLGVRRLKSGKYQAYLNGVSDGILRWYGVGIFDTDVEAARARDASARTRLSGEGLRFNFPDGIPDAIHKFLRLAPDDVIARFRESQARAAALPEQPQRPDAQIDKVRAQIAYLEGERLPMAKPQPGAITFTDRGARKAHRA